MMTGKRKLQKYAFTVSKSLRHQSYSRVVSVCVCSCMTSGDRVGTGQYLTPSLTHTPTQSRTRRYSVELGSLSRY